MQGNTDRRRLGRRALAMAAAALALARPARAAPNLPADDTLVFAILRDDAPVGTHRLTFERGEQRTVVRSAIDIAVNYGPLTVYRFAQRVAETWTGDGFFAIDSHTDDNGTPAWMHAERDASGKLQVAGSGTAPYAAPPGALASTYWNPAILGVPVISSQDGHLTAPEVIAGPVEPVPADGGFVLARRSEMRGDPDLEIWYDLHARWAHLRLRRYGSVITYLRA